MRKIMIVTLYFYNNFGSVLQAFALRKMLHRLSGRKVDILPYRPLLPEYEYFQEEPLKKLYQEKCQKFDEFRIRYLGMECGSTFDLHSSNLKKVMEYDFCVVGSDIVWGREFSGLDPVYFLQPAGTESKKIAYAASVLLDYQGNTEDDGLFARSLSDFDAVSVRENSAVNSIQKFTDTEVQAVLDPTLLLDVEDYKELEIENEDMQKDSYLLSYFLTHDPAVVNYTNLLARKLNLRVIHYFADYPSRVFNSDAGCFAFAGPGEFLGYIKNAACIFTNSFHGTCFSCIYRKPFYTYMAARSMLSRVRDMSYRLGLERHFFTDFRDLKKVTTKIDYSQFEQELIIEREKSISFLKDALEV
jgi:hypothetical protein